MAEEALPLARFSADVHLKALQGLVQRYEHEGDPIHYRKAAVDINEATCSSCLRYFGDTELIEVEKQGVYVPSGPVIEFFTEEGNVRKRAVRDIADLLSGDPVFKEVSFHLSDEDLDLDNLVERISKIIDIEEDNLEQIERAVEIFAELEVLEINEDDVVSLPDERDIPESIETEDEDQEDTTDEANIDVEEEPVSLADIDPADLELSPIRGDPEKLYEYCSVLSEKGEWEKAEIAERLGESERTIQRHFRYGDELGFIKREHGNLSLTKSGYDLGFENEFGDTEEHFLDAILEFDFYALLLNRCLKRVGPEDSDPTIKSSDCEHELRTHFEFTDEGQDSIRRAINTFLKTVEASGYGDYIVGSRDRETRLELTAEEVDNLRETVRVQVTVEREAELETEGTDDAAEDESEEATEDSEEDDTFPLDPGLKGPPLRISSFRIQNFRNIQDSGDVRLENITTFIGENETGKTSTLEAIASFNHSAAYLPRDISNDTVPDYEFESEESAHIPVVTLRFEITEEISEAFYDEKDLEGDLPITVEVTKFGDGHFENTSDNDIPNPSPDIVYYNEYDLISDSIHFDEEEEEQNDTFLNLLKVGGLDNLDFLDSNPRRRYDAIERAENTIEDRLNKVWSQKDIGVNLRYEDSDQRLYLWIQDKLEEERPFTEPSQRSEGFQWFFSFYVNLLAETATDEDGYKILLLDDPAVHLHPSGKQDWLESVEEIAEHEQVLYTSHSPYLINKRHPSRIRTVEDSSEGTQFNADIFDAEEGTLEPLRNALGINLSSSPFVDEGQVLVEGPSEYYILSAVGAYFDLLDRDFFDWTKVSLMPVRGANDTIGKASWLSSEDLEYTILLDSDSKGQDVAERISDHHVDIEDNRVLLLSTPAHDTDVVIEDLFDPIFYVDAFNEYYEGFAEDFEHAFEPLEIEEDGHNTWRIGAQEHDGSRIDEVLVSELERQHVADELRNDDGDIELLKRQIAEVISEKINNNQVKPDDLQHFNRLMSEIDSKLDL